MKFLGEQRITYRHIDFDEDEGGPGTAPGHADRQRQRGVRSLYACPPCAPTIQLNPIVGFFGARLRSCGLGRAPRLKSSCGNWHLQRGTRLLPSPLQVFAHHQCSRRALTHHASYLLCTTYPTVTGGEDPIQAGFEVRPGDNKSNIVQLKHTPQEVSVGAKADEDEDCTGLYFPGLTCSPCNFGFPELAILKVRLGTQYKRAGFFSHDDSLT